MPVRVRRRANHRLVYALFTLTVVAAVGVANPAAGASPVDGDPSWTVVAQLPQSGIDGWFDGPDSVQELAPLPMTGNVDESSDLSPPSDVDSEEESGSAIMPWIPPVAIGLAVALLIGGAAGLYFVTRRPPRRD